MPGNSPVRCQLLIIPPPSIRLEANSNLLPALGTTEAILFQFAQLCVCFSYRLRDDFDDLHAVGDCLSPRTAEEAVLEGLKVGASI